MSTSVTLALKPKPVSPNTCCHANSNPSTVASGPLTRCATVYTAGWPVLGSITPLMVWRCVPCTMKLVTSLMK